MQVLETGMEEELPEEWGQGEKTDHRGRVFLGKAAAHIYQPHKEAKVRSFKMSLLPMQRHQTDFGLVSAWQQLCPISCHLHGICLRILVNYALCL